MQKLFQKIHKKVVFKKIKNKIIRLSAVGVGSQAKCLAHQ